MIPDKTEKEKGQNDEKRFFAALLAALMLLSLTACGGKKTDTTVNNVQSTSKAPEPADETSADNGRFIYEFGGRAYEDVLLKYFEAIENDDPDAVLDLYDPRTLAAHQEDTGYLEQEIREASEEGMREDIPCFGSDIVSVTVSERLSRLDAISMGEVLGAAQAYEEEGYQAMAAVMSEMEQIEGVYAKVLFADGSQRLFSLSLERQKGDWYLWDAGHAHDPEREQYLVIWQYIDALRAADTDTILRELMYEPVVRCLCEAGGDQTEEAYLASVDMAYPYYGADAGSSSVSGPEEMPPEDLAAYNEQVKKACQQVGADPIGAENGVYGSYWLSDYDAGLNVDLTLAMYEYDGEWYIGGVTVEQH